MGLWMSGAGTFGAIVAVALLAGCASAPAEAPPTLSAGAIAGYETYDWTALTAGRKVEPRDVDAVRVALDRSLAVRGYRRSSAGALSLSLEIVVQRQYSGEFGAVGDPMAVFPTYQGRLRLAASDAQSGRLIWQGEAWQPMMPGDAPEVERAVSDLLLQIPAAQNAAPGN